MAGHQYPDQGTLRAFPFTPDPFTTRTFTVFGATRTPSDLGIAKFCKRSMTLLASGRFTTTLAPSPAGAFGRVIICTVAGFRPRNVLTSALIWPSLRPVSRVMFDMTASSNFTILSGLFPTFFSAASLTVRTKYC